MHSLPTRAWPAAFAGALLLCASPADALATFHGAVYHPPQYAGPGDAVPRSGGAPAPVGRTPAAPTAPALPGRTGRSGAPAPSPLPPSAVPRRSSAVSGRSGPALELPDPTRWTWWWELHRESLLELREKLFGSSPTTGSEGFYLGYRSRRDQHGAQLPPTEKLLRDAVVPALVAALDEPSADLTSASLVALARIGDDLGDEPRAAIERILVPHLASSNQEIAETAAIALGILENESSGLRLAELLADGHEGRRLVGGKPVSERTRAFAAYGLGLLGRRAERIDVQRYVVQRLAATLERAQGARPDVATACVLAIARTPLPCAGETPKPVRGAPRAPILSRETQSAFLLELFRDRGRDRTVRAHAAVALGWLQEGADGFDGELRETIVSELLKRLRVSSGEQTVQRGCILALGNIVGGDANHFDSGGRRVLLEIDEQSGDAGSRHFARIALARVAARAEAHHPEEAARLTRHLLGEVARERNDTRRWSALALGLLEHERMRAGRAPNPLVQEALRSALASVGAPLDVGAHAIAVGLAQDTGAEDLLIEKLSVVAEDEARGHLLVALGMLGAPRGEAQARATLEEATYRPALLREAATALGLAGAPGVVALLVARLDAGESGAASASVAQALGRVGDREAVRVLLDFLGDRARPGTSRAFAAVGLGLVGDRDRLPWSTPFAVGVHYLAAPVSLYSGDARGLLNIL